MMDYSAAKYGGEADLYGRQGQKQDGIDIIMKLPPISQTRPTCVSSTCVSSQPSQSPSSQPSQPPSFVQNLLCVQCKNYKSTRVTTGKIDTWIQEAEKIPFPIIQLVIAIINGRDVKLQEHVIKVSQTRLQQGKFPVEIVFWEGISHFIKQNDNILKIYYPELYNYFISMRMPPDNSSITANVASYPNLILSEEDLKLSFLDLFMKHHIKNFMEVSPFAGFSMNLVAEYDVFEQEVQRLKDMAIQVSSKPKFAEISEFMYAISDFATYIALKSTINNNGFVLLTPELRMQYDVYKGIETELEQKRNNIVDLFRKVMG